MNKKTRERKTAAKVQSPVNISLTIDDRDAIDRAKRRLRGYVTLLGVLVDSSDDMGDLESEEALGVLQESMADAVNVIETTFGEADERHGAR